MPKIRLQFEPKQTATRSNTPGATKQPSAKRRATAAPGASSSAAPPLAGHGQAPERRAPPRSQPQPAHDVPARDQLPAMDSWAPLGIDELGAILAQVFPSPSMDWQRLPAPAFQSIPMEQSAPVFPLAEKAADPCAAPAAWSSRAYPVAQAPQSAGEEFLATTRSTTTTSPLSAIDDVKNARAAGKGARHATPRPHGATISAHGRPDGRRRLTAAQKQTISEHVQSGKNLAETARAASAPRSTVNAFVADLKFDGTTSWTELDLPARIEVKRLIDLGCEDALIMQTTGINYASLKNARNGGCKLDSARRDPDRIRKIQDVIPRLKSPQSVAGGILDTHEAEELAGAHISAIRIHRRDELAGTDRNWTDLDQPERLALIRMIQSGAPNSKIMLDMKIKYKSLETLRFNLKSAARSKSDPARAAGRNSPFAATLSPAQPEPTPLIGSHLQPIDGAATGLPHELDPSFWLLQDIAEVALPDFIAGAWSMDTRPTADFDANEMTWLTQDDGPMASQAVTPLREHGS